MKFETLLFILGIITFIAAMTLLIVHPNYEYVPMDYIVGGVGCFVSGFIICPKSIKLFKIEYWFK